MNTRLVFGVVVASWIVSAQFAGAVAPTPAEMAELHRWVTAKLEGVGKQEWPESALVVFANHGHVQKNARGGKPMRIVDDQFTRGLYCHAPSHVVVHLPGPGKTFSAVVGVDTNDQTHPGRGSVVFSIRAGGEEKFCSSVMREGMPGVPFKIDVGGARECTLEVGDAGDYISCDQADWADAKVVLDDGSTVWIGELPLFEADRSYTTDPPFSFQYDGKPSSEFFKDWNCKREVRELDEKRTQHVISYTDPQTGLVVRQVAVVYHDFPTVEWTLYFKNTGKTDTPILEAIQALDAQFRCGPVDEFVLHHHQGDSNTPDSYEPLVTTLGPKSRQRFAPPGGRPTEGQWPYYNIQWADQGVIAVIGWPGQWAAEFTRDETTGLRVRGGQELTHFKLHPGEEVRTPLVVLQFYRGDRIRAQNAWRRWMLAHNLPRLGGKLPPTQLTSCSGGFFPGLKCNEADEKRFIDAFTKRGIKLDYWWMDAGWYPCDSWPQVGTWEVDRERFPGGIRAVSDHAHAKGMKLILWFEPERVAPGTWLYENRPQWLLGRVLLDLGNPKAREWLTDRVDQLSKEHGIDLYRQDFNMAPLGFWRGNDANDRQGITEIRHVEGYLAYWDELRRRHPNMLIDSCASGGRRNDLETMRRAVPLLRSDYQSFHGDPRFACGNQCHLYGLALWLPYFGTGTYYSDNQTLYAGRSFFCPAFGYCYDVRKPGADWTTIRRLVDNWRKIAHYFFGDYYPLTPYSLERTVWMAWQFDCPREGEGMVQAFRRDESIYEAARLHLHGLELDACYRLTDLDKSGSTEMTGRELTEKGFLVSIPEQPGSVVITYKKAK